MKQETTIENKSGLLALKEAAKRLNISRVTLWKERKDGKLNVINIRGQKFIRETEIESYIERNTSELAV